MKNPDLAYFSRTFCPICGMRRADPKHRGKRAERCSQTQKRQAQEKKG